MSVYEEKIEYFRKVIDDIIRGINYYNSLNIITINEYNNAQEGLEKTVNLINTINYDNIINDLQYINNNISSLIKTHGCFTFENIINICLSTNFATTHFVNELFLKYKLLEKYLHPINYKIINWTTKTLKSSKEISKKEIAKNKIIDEKSILESNTLECFDMAKSSKNFIIRVYGIIVVIHDYNNKKTLVIENICDEILLTNSSNIYIINKKNDIHKFITESGAQNNELFNKHVWLNFCNNLLLKELLIYNSQEIYNKYIFIITQVNSYNQKTLENLVQNFITSDLFNQRTMLIQLLLSDDKLENLYIAYLLYDLLIDDKLNNEINEQKKIYNSLNWACKKHFKNALQKTVEYSNDLLNFDSSRIPLEQQICLMKANVNVKEKAMQKLKELKSRSEDSGSKARQYLEGLLKIPFNIYREEDILKIKNEISNLLNNLKTPLKKDTTNDIINNTNISMLLNEISSMDNNSNNNIKNINIIKKIKNKNSIIITELLTLIVNYVEKNKKKINVMLVKSIKNLQVEYGVYYDIKLTKENMLYFIKSITLNSLQEDKNNEFKNNEDKNLQYLQELILLFKQSLNCDYFNYLINVEKNINEIVRKNETIVNYINTFNTTLDSAVYGHKNAKLQIERILGQWINGETSGYCFGFEGLPGIGKTSLAKKGIANCLKDKNNNPRPFSLIALGGSCNGSILDGHNYTYVGSTWGKIVDILIEHKCMNPIIFIDELDKVSKTEHGKEIIGILTHLVDSTQNTNFQDKYFSNIDLDLSKVLFIFSYNDAELIDKILLDRIHRIKFDTLTLDDKLIIAKDYLLPELYTKFRLNNVVLFEDNIIKFIIEHYTNESGVRKLKEVLFEIISSINLELLKDKFIHELPYIITLEYVEEILKIRHKIIHLSINKVPEIGIINGLWANSFGNSGILHIECKFFHSSTFLDLKLTGMQGDVMKESMSVAKTLALSLLTNEELKLITKELEESKLQGIHIHVPEGATPKDGPSAGAAITIVLYSLLTKRKIKNNIAITGEICLQGKITTIGGLDLKIVGGMRAGVTTFFYPKTNAKDFENFCEKYNRELTNYSFIEVENIIDAIKDIIIY
jgi:ATP-dependent Lon protease